MSVIRDTGGMVVLLLTALMAGGEEMPSPAEGLPEDFEAQVGCIEQVMSKGSWQEYIRQCFALSEGFARVATRSKGDAATVSEAGTEAFFSLGMQQLEDKVCPVGMFRKEIERVFQRAPAGLLKDRVFASYGRSLAAGGHSAAAGNVFERLGVIRDWYLVGPFDNERGTGFNTEFGPEEWTRTEEGAERPLEKEFKGKKASVSWRKIHISSFDGTVDLDELMRPKEWSACYLLTWFRLDGDGEYIFSVGSDDGLKVWVNGEKVLARRVRRSIRYDQDQVLLRLKEGINILLVKCLQEEGEWAFHARLTPVEGGGRVRFEYAAGRTPGVPGPEPEWKPLSSDPLARLDELLERTWQLRDKEWIVTAAGPDKLAEIIERKGIKQTPGEYFKTVNAAEAEQLLEGVMVKLPPLAAAGLFFFKGAIHLGRCDYDVYEERPHRVAFRRAAEAAERPLTLYFQALSEFPVARMEPEKNYNPYLKTLRKVLSTDPSHAMALEKLFSYYGPVNVLPKAEECLSVMPGDAEAKPFLSAMLLGWKGRDWEVIGELKPYLENPYYIPGMTLLASRLAQSERYAEASALMGRAVSYLYTDEDLLERYARTLFASGDYRKVAGIVKVASGVIPLSGALFRICLQLAEGENDYEQAAGLVARRLELVPQDASLYELRGRYARILDKEDEAREAFANALKVEPNLVSVKRYLEVTGEAEDYSVPYLVDAKPLIEEARGFQNPKDYPALVLVDHMVFKVARDGLSSYTVHKAVKLLTANGVQRYGQITPYYHREEQTLKVLAARVHRPDGRVDEARVPPGGAITVPNPGIGDVVEVRYRVDDVKRSFFGNHEEQVFLFGDVVPMKISEFVLIAPKDYTLSYYVSNAELEPVKKEEAANLVYRWRYEDTPVVEYEPLMPNMTELVPTLYVSHFADWKDFGKWYWSLIREQHTVSDKLREKVREVTGGKKTLKEKIRAIYHFVTNDIEYVAWEFGVHGFKPYDASNILERKFGDCKDKATLMKVMLGEIGVKAYQALIRSDSSYIKQDMTLPLIRHFNHAICYVPAGEGYPEMWLDGTAQYYPFGPPPPYDSIRISCVVEEEDGGELREVPPPPPDANNVEVQAEIHFSEGGPDGLIAHVEVKCLNKGLSEQIIRHYFHNPGLRKERLEDLFSRRYAECTLNWEKFPDLTDMYAECRYSFSLDLPRFTRTEGNGFAAPLLRGFPRMPSYRELTTLGTRTKPLVLRFFHPYRARVVYRCPEGYRFASYPEGADASCEGGKFSLVSRLEEGDLVIEENIVITKERASVEDYSDFRRFVLAIDQAESHDIVLRPAE